MKKRTGPERMKNQEKRKKNQKKVKGDRSKVRNLWTKRVKGEMIRSCVFRVPEVKIKFLFLTNER